MDEQGRKIAAQLDAAAEGDRQMPMDTIESLHPPGVIEVSLVEGAGVSLDIRYYNEFDDPGPVEGEAVLRNEEATKLILAIASRVVEHQRDEEDWARVEHQP